MSSAISKIILYKPLRSLMQQHPAVVLQTWVDDVSFDIKGTDPTYVAREAILAFRTLRRLLEEAGLKINTDKTGFIASSRDAQKLCRLSCKTPTPSAASGSERCTREFTASPAYLRCTECRRYILARCNQDAFNTFVGEACHVGPLPPALWHGHVTHTMVRTGAQATCTRCKIKARVT